MRNKKIARFMPAVLVAAVMVFILLPMGVKSVKAAQTGSGTKDDPLIVDNFTDLKAALESDKDTYIVVNEFANTGDKGYYELQSGIDYDDSDDGIIEIPGYEKHLEINCKIDCRDVNNGSIDIFIYNYGLLDISGDGTLTASLFGNNNNHEAILIFNMLCTVIIDGNVTIEANLPVVGECDAFAIVSEYGTLDIKNGTIIGNTNKNSGKMAAVQSFYDSELIVSGGNFKCNASDTDTVKYGINIMQDDDVIQGNVVLKGGTFEGIYAEESLDGFWGSNEYLSDYLDAGCKYAYSNKLSSGQIVQEIGDKAGEKVIDGTVRVGIPVTAADITITEPVVGAAPDFTGSTGTGYKTSVEWLIGNDKTKKLSATDKFEGRDYVALVKLTAEDGYILDEASLKQNLKLNGVAKSNFNCGSAGSGGSLPVPFQLRYSEVSVTITEPVANAVPDTSVTTEDTGYTGNVVWYQGVLDQNGQPYSSSPVDRFEAGKTYTAKVNLNFKEDYSFDGINFKMKVNGVEAQKIVINSSNATYYVTYTLPQLPVCKELSVTIDKLVVGEYPSYKIVSNDTKYTAEIILTDRHLMESFKKIQHIKP